MLTIPNEIKALLKQDSVRKNFRVHFPDGERADITNANVIGETVTLTESLCSQNRLVFGLCETPQIEFETVGVENIKGAIIECSMEIECGSDVIGSSYKSDISMNVYPIPYGTFVVDSCKKQSDMSHRKIIAYNGISADGFNLPHKFVDAIQGFYWYKKTSFKVSVDTIVKLILPNYQRNYEEKTPYPSIYDTTQTVEKTIGSDVYKLDITFSEYSINYNNDGDNVASAYVTFAKPQYTEEYKNSVNAIYERLQAEGWDDAKDIECYVNSVEVPSIWKREDESVSSYTSHGIQYYIPTSKKQYVYYPIKPFELNEEEIIAPNLYFKYLKSGTSTTIGYDWEAITRLKYFLPTRMVLYKNNTILLDTGRKANVVLSDNDNNLFHDDLNLFLYGSFNKQKVTMTREDSNYNTSSVKVNLYQLNFESITQTDMRDLLSSYFELKGKHAILKRDNTVSVADISEAPVINIENGAIKTLWYDDYLSQEIARVICTYTSEETENDAFASRNKYSVMPDVYRTYSLSDNSLVQQNTFTEEKMETVLNTILSSANYSRYMPTELEIVGMPWLEVGDYLQITTNEETFPVIVEKRVLTGINNLADSITCVDEVENTKNSYSTYNETTKTVVI